MGEQRPMAGALSYQRTAGAGRTPGGRVSALPRCLALGRLLAAWLRDHAPRDYVSGMGKLTTFIYLMNSLVSVTKLVAD